MDHESALECLTDLYDRAVTAERERDQAVELAKPNSTRLLNAERDKVDRNMQIASAVAAYEDMQAATAKRERDAAVVTAVHVARDWAIQQNGDRYNTSTSVEHYMRVWLMRNGAEARGAAHAQVVTDLVEAVWALAELPDQDPINLAGDDYHGTSEEARAMLTAQYEADLTHALSRITWKA